MGLTVGIVIGILLGFFGPEVWFRLRVKMELAALRKNIIPQEADASKLCNGPHPWMETMVMTPDGEKRIPVCSACGLISGTNKVASQEAIDKIEEMNRVREIEQRLYSEFLNAEDDEIKKYFSKEIESGLDFDKLAHVHAAGMSFSSRFSIYRAAKTPELEKELNKSNA